MMIMMIIHTYDEMISLMEYSAVDPLIWCVFKHADVDAMGSLLYFLKPDFQI